MFNFLFGDPKNKTVWFYTRVFFFMIIPVFGLFYTLYLAFIEDRDEDIRRVAKGALIVRILAVIAVLVLLFAGVTYIMPNLERWLSSSMMLFSVFGR